jgi:hypothetical protein
MTPSSQVNFIEDVEAGFLSTPAIHLAQSRYVHKLGEALHFAEKPDVKDDRRSAPLNGRTHCYCDDGRQLTLQEQVKILQRGLEFIPELTRDEFEKTLNSIGQACNEIRESLTGATIVLADEVAEMVKAGDTPQWPSLAPALRNSVIQFVQRFSTESYHMAVHLIYNDADQVPDERLEGQPRNPRARWVLEYSEWVELGDARGWHQLEGGLPPGTIEGLKAEGLNADLVGQYWPLQIDEQGQLLEKPPLSPVIQVALTTIALMHCKNVALRDQPPHRAEKRRRERQGKPQFIRKTLELEPLKAVLCKEGGYTGPSSFGRALHICRGHFRTYEEHGLFGKYYGTFWIPQMLRGNPEHGIVDKNYEVHATRRASA